MPMFKNRKATKATPETKIPKFWNIASLDDDTGVIELTGDVVAEQPRDWWGDAIPGEFITPAGFKEDLEAVKDKANIVIRINSCGGDLFSGIAIHNAIADLKANKTVIVDGIAASAASIIACQPDADIQIYPGSMLMIHGAACVVWDYMTLEDAQKVVNMLDAANRAIKQIYQKKVDIAEDELDEMLRVETWMVGQEAIDLGFADTLLEAETEPEMELSADHKILMVAGVRHDISTFRNMPENQIPVNKSIRPETKAVPVGNIKPTAKTGSDERRKPMTLDELRAQEPDLVSQIETEAVSAAQNENHGAVEAAVQAERDRLSAIDAIAGTIGDPALVNEAKYGETACNAEQLALRAIQKQAKIGANFLEALEADTVDSGVQSVEADATPIEGQEDAVDPMAYAKSLAENYLRKENK